MKIESYLRCSQGLRTTQEIARQGVLVGVAYFVVKPMLLSDDWKILLYRMCSVMEEAFVLIRVQQDLASPDPEFMNSVKLKLAKLEGVRQVKGVFGIYGFVAVAETRSVEELGVLVTKNMKNIKGVVQTDTMVVGF